MNQPSRSERSEREIFLQSLEFPPGSGRAAFLDLACAGKPELRSAVEALLAAHEDETFMKSPAVQTPIGGNTPSTVGDSMGHPDRVGCYRLLQLLGEGGCATVHLAEQEEPLRRRVALKLLRAGMDNAAVIARFEAERQVLALMDHPCIAKIFDAGTAEDGRSYFAMECIEGPRITRFCADQKLSLNDRLQLFVRVCKAVEHAHQKGIIHRDLKPSNILVSRHDDVPMPKVIDFGIAKALHQPLTGNPNITQLHALIGTPAYMSPEQAEMQTAGIDTRTDIYSLGVLLYELLTGETPFDSGRLAAAGLGEMRRILREEEPEPPSARIRRLQRKRDEDGQSRGRLPLSDLASALQVDLDSIVLKCLEKDRTRRYATIHELVEDVDAYLGNRPVRARVASRGYRLGKFIRRHRVGFTTAGIFAIAGGFGLALMTWLFVERTRAYRQATQAERQQAHLRAEAERARQDAETQAAIARRRAYAADIHFVSAALDAWDLRRAKQLLGPYQSGAAAALRGWEWSYLWEQCRSEALWTLCELGSPVWSIAVSGSGEWLAVTDSRGHLSVWDLKSRERVGDLDAGGAQAMLAFSPSLPWLSFSAIDHTREEGQRAVVRFWDCGNRRFMEELPLSAPCNGLAFATNGTRLLTSTTEGELSTWSFPELRNLSSVQVPRLSLTAPAVQASPDLSLAAFALPTGQIHLIETASGRVRWKHPLAGPEKVRSLAFSPNGEFLAMGTGDAHPAVMILNVFFGHIAGHLRTQHAGIGALTFSSDGEILASGSADQTIALWEMKQGRSPRIPPRPVPSSFDSDRPGQRRLRSEPDPPFRLMTFGATWSATARLRGHEGEVTGLVHLPGPPARLVSGGRDGRVLVWDAEQPSKSAEPIPLPWTRPFTPIRAWSFGADSKSVVTFNEAGKVDRWQGKHFERHETLFEVNGSGLVFSPLGRYAAVTNRKDQIELWDLDGRRMNQVIGSTNDPATPLLFTPRSQHLVFRRARDGHIVEWDPEGAVQLNDWAVVGLPETTHPVMAISNDESLWAVLHDDGSGVLRDRLSGTEHPLQLAVGQVRHAVFSPNGRHLAVISSEGAANIWDLEARRSHAIVRAFRQGMSSVTYAPDGSRLAVGGRGEESIKLWDADVYQELLTLHGYGSEFLSVAFSPDGTLLGAANAEGVLSLWPTATP